MSRGWFFALRKGYILVVCSQKWFRFQTDFWQELLACFTHNCFLLWVCFLKPDLSRGDYFRVDMGVGCDSYHGINSVLIGSLKVQFTPGSNRLLIIPGFVCIENYFDEEKQKYETTIAERNLLTQIFKCKWKIAGLHWGCALRKNLNLNMGELTLKLNAQWSSV